MKLTQLLLLLELLLLLLPLVLLQQCTIFAVVSRDVAAEAAAPAAAAASVLISGFIFSPNFWFLIFDLNFHVYFITLILHMGVGLLLQVHSILLDLPARLALSLSALSRLFLLSS